MLAYLGGNVGMDQFNVVASVAVPAFALGTLAISPWSASRRSNPLEPYSAPSSWNPGHLVPGGQKRILRALSLGPVLRWVSPGVVSPVAAGNSVYLDVSLGGNRPNAFGPRAAEISVWSWYSPSRTGSEWFTESSTSPVRAKQLASGIPFGYQGTLPMDIELGPEANCVTIATHYYASNIYVTSPSWGPDAQGYFCNQQAAVLVCDIVQ